ncbi:MAG: class I SAM-dependent methyltransferase [Polyangiaceae bacterium]|nr:class I SAM-dependent methyltransferase [Polyangiaceae bacterium]
MTGHGLGLRELLRDRRRKLGLYDTAAYWDKKARAYSGLAVSNWPSNAYNVHVHARQTALIDELLGDVGGLAVADLGAGTGRMSLHLARRGARVHGFDFSSRSLEVARRDAAAADLDLPFTEHDVLRDPDPALVGTFDVAMTVGCLALACRDLEALEDALGRVASLVRVGGRVLLIEPVHGTWLLARILRASVDAWCERAERQGLALIERRGVMFVPARYLLAFRDLPQVITTPVFSAGERILDGARAIGRGRPLEALADYKALLFCREARPHTAPTPPSSKP